MCKVALLVPANLASKAYTQASEEYHQLKENGSQEACGAVFPLLYYCTACTACTITHSSWPSCRGSCAVPPAMLTLLRQLQPSGFLQVLPGTVCSSGLQLGRLYSSIDASSSQPKEDVEPSFGSDDQAASGSPPTAQLLRSRELVFGDQTSGAGQGGMLEGDLDAVTGRPVDRLSQLADAAEEQPSTSQSAAREGQPGDRLYSERFGYAAIAGTLPIPAGSQGVLPVHPRVHPQRSFMPGQTYEPEVRELSAWGCWCALFNDAVLTAGCWQPRLMEAVD
jgi:hypothetical protein